MREREVHLMKKKIKKTILIVNMVLIVLCGCTDESNQLNSTKVTLNDTEQAEKNSMGENGLEIENDSTSSISENNSGMDVGETSTEKSEKKVHIIMNWYKSKDNKLMYIEEYDENGNIIRYEDLGDAVIIYEYEDNKLIKDICFDSNGKILYWHEWERNVIGNKERITVYGCEEGKDPEIQNILEVVYDKDGRIIEECDYSVHSNNELNDRQEYVYDGQGNIVKIYRYDSDNSLYDEISIKYEYENDNIVKKVEYHSKNGMSYTDYTEYKYDAEGNLIEENLYCEYGETISKQYEYDESNRLIKRYEKGYVIEYEYAER